MTHRFFHYSPSPTLPISISALQFVSLSACFVPVDSATFDDHPLLSTIDITKEHPKYFHYHYIVPIDRVRCKLIKQYSILHT